MVESGIISLYTIWYTRNCTNIIRYTNTGKYPYPIQRLVQNEIRYIKPCLVHGEAYARVSMAMGTNQFLQVPLICLMEKLMTWLGDLGNRPGDELKTWFVETCWECLVKYVYFSLVRCEVMQGVVVILIPWMVIETGNLCFPKSLRPPCVRVLVTGAWLTATGIHLLDRLHYGEQVDSAGHLLLGLVFGSSI